MYLPRYLWKKRGILMYLCMEKRIGSSVFLPEEMNSNVCKSPISQKAPIAHIYRGAPIAPIPQKMPEGSTMAGKPVNAYPGPVDT